MLVRSVSRFTQIHQVEEMSWRPLNEGMSTELDEQKAAAENLSTAATHLQMAR